MKAHVILPHDIPKWQSVKQIKNRAKDRTLRYPTNQWLVGRLLSSNFHILLLRYDLNQEIAKPQIRKR